MGSVLAEDIKAVFFDHDDTLVGTIGPKWKEHKYIAKRYYNKNLTDEELTRHWGKPLRELVCKLYGTDDAERALIYNKDHHIDYPKILFKATIPTLTHIHKSGRLVGIITATNRFSLEYDLKLHKVPNNIIDYTQTADETSFHKPDPRVFEPAINWLKVRGIKPSEVIYIGDALHDMKAALGAGFNFLGVETGLVSAKQFAANKTKSVPNISHILKA